MAKKKTKSKIKLNSVDPFYFNYFAEGGKTNALILAEARANQADYLAYAKENNIERTLPPAEEIKALALLYQQEELAMQQKDREAASIRDTKIAPIPISEIDSFTSAPRSIAPIHIPLSSKVPTTQVLTQEDSNRESEDKNITTPPASKALPTQVLNQKDTNRGSKDKSITTPTVNEKGFSMKTKDDVFLPEFNQVTPNIENFLRKEYPRHEKDLAEYLGELASYLYDGVISEAQFTSDAQDTERKRRRSMIKSASKRNPQALINQKDNLINFANKLLKSDRLNPRLMRELFKEFDMSILPYDMLLPYYLKAFLEYPTNNSYEDGGFLKGIGNNIGGIASGVGSLFSNFKQQSEIADTSGIESNIGLIENTQIGGSNDALMDQFNTFTTQDRVKASDLRQGNAVGGALSGIASGAGAGMSFGAPGAIIGGVVGGISSIFGSHRANKKAKKKARELNQLMDEAEAYRDLSFDNAVANADKLNDQNMLANFAAYGGHITNGTQFKDNLTFFNEGGTHETNPMGGVMIGMDQEGVPNMVEEGEVKWNDYIFSNRIKPNKESLQLLEMNKKWKDKSFAELAKSLNKESDERPNDPISKNGKEDVYTKLQALLEMTKLDMEQSDTPQGNMFYGGGEADFISGYLDYSLGKNSAPLIPTRLLDIPKLNLPSYVTNDISAYFTGPKRFPVESKLGIPEDIAPVNNLANVLSSAKGFKDIVMKPSQDITDPSVGSSLTEGSGSDGFPTWMRYAPVAGSMLGAGLALSNKPDLSGIDNIREQINNSPDISYNPLGNYISPNLIDPNLQANTLKQSANRVNDTLLNTSGGNRALAMASLVASGYNNQNNLGQTLMGIGDANHLRRLQAETFNKDTDATNQRMDFAALQSNAQNRQYGLRNLMALEEMRQGLKANHDTSVSANLTNLFDNIGNIGRENFAFNQVNTNNAYYGIKKDGSVYYKPAFYKQDEETRKNIKKEAEGK